MTKELWATYSVIDHLQPRYLALDVMLFDRLVFPVPQRPRIDGNPTEIGDVVWGNDSAALEHWKNWDPEAQEKVLDVLKALNRRHSKQRLRASQTGRCPTTRSERLEPN